MTNEHNESDRPLAESIGLTRRQLMSTVGGLAAGTAATGVASATYRNGYDGPLYYTDWTCRYGKKSDEKDDERSTKVGHPSEPIQTRDELASEQYETGYTALSDGKKKKIDKEFTKQYPDDEEERTRSPNLDLGKFTPGQKGSLEFRTHILEHPLVLRLCAPGYEKQGWMDNVRATLRYTPCPDDCDQIIVSGSLCEVLEAVKKGVPLDGNRSQGDRGDFEPRTTHGFELEWEVPKSCKLPDDRKRLDLKFKAKRRPKDAEPTTRKYTVHAIDVEITYNSFGTHNPVGAMYVLEENLEAVREAEGVDPGTSGVDTSVIEPLVLRANVGDTVKIEFVNSLGCHPDRDGFEKRPASIHPTGIAYEVDESDGMAVGYNENTVVEPGESTTYTWHADSQGAYLFHDGAYQAWDSIPDDGNNEEINSMARGLFGALMVEPPGSTWTDPCTGAPLRSGVRADIHHPEFPDHREFVPIYHDHGVVRPDGLTVPGTDIEQMLHAINYRAERTSERIGETGEEGRTFYSSWVHGDPGGGDNVFEAYQGDPIKFAIVGANTEENHVHHLHEHRWNQVPFNGESATLDSQNLGMGEGYRQYLTVAHGTRSLRPDQSGEEAFSFGAGGYHGSVGDLLFHCHMFPHYGEGMSGFMRIHNQQQLHLQPLPNNEPTLPLDSDILGFPDFIPAEEGEIPPKPPLSQHDDPRQPTPEEEEALQALIPGAPYTDPCDIEDAEAGADPTQPDPTEVEPDIIYDIVAIEAKLVYNDHGDYDPDGKVFVPEEDVDAVLNGEMMPEPLFVRANVGDCVEFNLRNELEGPASAHVHFVGFDQLGSDSTMVGYNYDSGTDSGDTMTYRWFADDEGIIFLHDHMRGIGEIMHGEFGALIVEPEGSEWLDPHTGEPIRHGSQAIINPPDDDAFREFCLEYHDFAPLIDPDKDGNGMNTQPDDPDDDAFVNPNQQHGVNAGVGAINYRNSPYYRRGPDPDPAYVHSSFVHGDPETPTLEAYPDERTIIRLVHGPYEEQHNFVLHEHQVDEFRLGIEDGVSQMTGSSEQFSFTIHEGDSHDFEHLENAAGLPFRDYLYGSMISHDVWDGMWGIHRMFEAEVDHLFPVPGTEPPEGKITKEELREVGHPAAFDKRAELGHRATLLYDEPTDDHTHPPDCPRRRNECIDGNPPPQAPDPGDPCPNAARTLEYDVSALQTQIDFNEYGDHDPHGIVFALDDHVEDVRKGNRPADSLLLRANVNDCIELTLTNCLPEDPDNHDDHPRMRTPEGDLDDWKRSNRISLHPNQLRYDPNGSDGATIGFNYDQTIAPGESITYRWYASQETPPVSLWDMADLRSNRHHGAFGNLIVEPEGAEWLDGCTGEPTVTNREAIITGHDEEDFREFALTMSDGRYIVNDELDSCVVPFDIEDDDVDADDPCNQHGDAEDQGFLSFNNRAEPFWRRFELNDDRQERVYDSDVHGDPATPIFNAHLDDPVRFRVTQTGDTSRGFSWNLADHLWPRFNEEVEDAPMISTDARFTPGKGITFELENGAGGPLGDTGDFIYKEMKERRRLEAGAWGIFRVDDLPHKRDGKKKRTRERDCAQPLPDRAKKVPLKDRPGWTVDTGDYTNDGTDDVLIGVPRSGRAGADAGAVYLFYGPVSQKDITDLSDADAILEGEHVGDKAGSSVSIQQKKITIGTCDGTRYVQFGDDLPHGEMSLGDVHQKTTVE